MKKCRKVMLGMLALVMCMLFVSPSPVESAACRHTYKKWGAQSPATCALSGYSRWRCTKCGHLKVQTEAKLGHKYVSRLKRGATCTEKGERAEVCSRCGKIASRTVIRPLGHSYTARKPTAAEKKKYHWGTTLTCKRCGHKTGSYADY